MNSEKLNLRLVRTLEVIFENTERLSLNPKFVSLEIFEKQAKDYASEAYEVSGLELRVRNTPEAWNHAKDWEHDQYENCGLFRLIRYPDITSIELNYTDKRITYFQFGSQAPTKITLGRPMS